MLSYTIYLVHIGFIELAETMFADWPALARAALAIALTFAFAGAMHIWVERPILRLRKHVERRGRLRRTRLRLAGTGEAA